MRQSLAAAFLALAAAAMPALAQDGAPEDGAPEAAEGPPLDAAAFDAYSQGKTMTYAAGGQIYGIEQYLPGHRVRWAFVGDICKEGTWFQQGDEICFDYEDTPALQCWRFYQTPAGLMARFSGDPASDPLIAVRESPEPLPCLGPKVGV